MKQIKKSPSLLMRRLFLLAVLVFIVLALTFFVVFINRILHNPTKNLLPQIPDLSSQSKVLRQKIKSEYKNIRQVVSSGDPNQQIGDSIGNLGKLYHANNFYNHAEQCYQVATYLNPKNPAWPYYLAVIKQMRGQNDSAVELLEKMLSLNPGYSPAILKLADIYYKGNQIDKAKAGYEKCLYLTPDNPYAYIGLARIAMDTSKWEIAQKHLEKAIESNPDFASLHRMMALVHEHFGRTDQMQKSLAHPKPKGWHFYEAPDPLLDELVDLCYDAQGILVYAAKLHYRDSGQRTIMLYQRALKLGSKNPQVYSAIGDLMVQVGLYEQACVCYEKLLAIAPNYRVAAAFNNYGNALSKLGKEDQAVKQYIRALEIDEKSVEARANLGELLCIQGKLEEGLEQIKKAIQIDPNDTRLYHLLGNISARAGKLNEAAEYFEKMLEIDPNSEIGHINLANILQRQANINRAVQAHKKNLEISPDDADVHKNLGILLSIQGNPEEAIKHYRRALQIKPDYIEALNNLAWLLATRKDIKSFNPEEAVQMALKACTLTNYKSLELMDTLAVSYAASGEFSKAVTFTEKALQLANSSGRDNAKEKLQKRLELFQAGQPYFEDGK